MYVNTCTIAFTIMIKGASEGTTFHAFVTSFPGLHTVKTFGLLQTYFGHLSCMPVV